ncbi:hypothetical protein KSP39_PZI022661 [Platanthera zijinensis]|uniref:DUF674 family protein n=1 Tax=Platanthera zijinensis TaxID=2320716 RepID=A0AAP0AVI5_9ASPA
MSSSSSKIEVKFLIDKEQQRVVFAEAGSDFVDLLFSFLTLPLGRIVRLLGKKSGWGSLDSLYESVEQLDAKLFQTEACKKMLLNPRSAAAKQCEGFKIKGIHERNPRRFYTCSQDDCQIQYTCNYYSYASKVLCSRCGKFMDAAWQWEKLTADEEGFIDIGTPDFIITDDLQVTLHSFKKGLSLFKQFHIEDSSVLEEKVMGFGTQEALKLLGRLLVSKSALTDIYFPDSYGQNNEDFALPINERLGADGEEKKISFELILNKKNNKVLYAEADDDFVDQLVSFLTFPLGSVLKFHSGNILSFGGCIQNLYSSAERINLEFFKSNNCRNMLLTPMLPTFYGIKNQILELKETESLKATVPRSCRKCYPDNGSKICKSAPCMHGISAQEYIEQNPKLVNRAPDNDELSDNDESSDDDGAFVVSSKNLWFRMTFIFLRYQSSLQ